MIDYRSLPSCALPRCFSRFLSSFPTLIFVFPPSVFRMLASLYLYIGQFFCGQDVRYLLKDKLLVLCRTNVITLVDNMSIIKYIDVLLVQ